MVRGALGVRQRRDTAASERRCAAKNDSTRSSRSPNFAAVDGAPIAPVPCPRLYRDPDGEKHRGSELWAAIASACRVGDRGGSGGLQGGSMDFDPTRFR